MGDALSPPDGSAVLTTAGGRVWKADGVIYEAIEVAQIEEQHAQEYVEAVRELTGPGERARILADVRGVRWASGRARAVSASD